MRLGEIKKILDEATDDEVKLVIESEPIYGGQAYIVRNYSRLINAIAFLSNQSWNGTDHAPIDELIKLADKAGDKKELTQDMYAKLTAYINEVNDLIPFYYDILREVVEDQEERVINIKLPDEIDNLEDLSELNKRLEKLFKVFQVDGEFGFKGFDRGTDWYVLIVYGYLTYHFFIACLMIAQEYLKARTEYFKSEKARLDYEASLKKGEEFSDAELDEYTERRLDLIIERKVEDAVKKIDETNGAQHAELATKLVKATKELISQMNDGVEFHLSLNPPNYASESNGMLEINYKSMQSERKKEIESKKTPAIEAPKTESDKGDDQKKSE